MQAMQIKNNILGLFHKAHSNVYFCVTFTYSLNWNKQEKAEKSFK